MIKPLLAYILRWQKARALRHYENGYSTVLLNRFLYRHSLEFIWENISNLAMADDTVSIPSGIAEH